MPAPRTGPAPRKTLRMSAEAQADFDAIHAALASDRAGHAASITDTVVLAYALHRTRQVLEQEQRQQ
jgi:hypothetical protein